MADLKEKKVLLIASQLFGYEKEIHTELENQGAYVTFFDQRPANDFLTKVFIRLNMKLFIQQKIDRYYAKIISDISLIEYDYVFLVSPEAINFKTLQNLKDGQPKAKVLVYMWDSIKNKKEALSLLPLADKFFTFDSNDILIDAKIRFLALFYISDYKKVTEQKEYKYDISFIGTVHSDRYKVVQSIQKFAIENNLSTYLYFYSPSKTLFWIKKIFTKNFRLINPKDISYISLSKEKIINIIQNSKVVIDIEHPSQNGLTMRTIEMLGAKRKLITTNANVKGYNFYSSQNIQVINRFNIVLDKNFVNTSFREVEENITLKYSLQEWINEIF